MAEANRGLIVAWGIAALLIIMAFLSFTMEGTWMGGIGMGWMMGGGVVLLALAVYVAYRFGRLGQKVEDSSTPR